jgi:hypothetical protein
MITYTILIGGGTKYDIFGKKIYQSGKGLKNTSTRTTSFFSFLGAEITDMRFAFPKVRNEG